MGIETLRKFVSCLVVFVVFLPPSCFSANILFFMGLSSHSHLISIWPLAEKLSENGHKITIVSPFAAKVGNPKIKEFSPSGFVEMAAEWKKQKLGHFETRNVDHFGQSWNILPTLATLMCQKFLESQDISTWIKETSFDLIFMDGLFNECALGLVHINKSKLITYGTSSVFPWFYELYGIPVESSWIPDCVNQFPQDMTFLQKVQATLVPIYWHFYRELVYFPKIEKLYKEKLNLKDLPNLQDVERNASLILVNTHFSEEFARVLPPLVVPIGGIHCKDSTEILPNEMEKFIKASGVNPVVYISFGATADITRASKKFQDLFFNLARKLSTFNFILKWNDKFPLEVPKNLFLANWIPQQALLAHPSVKLFITHAGLYSTQEAIFHSVPVIAFPVFAEQDYNAERIHRMGYGIRLEVTTVTLEELVETVTTILQDESYSQRIQELSSRFKDRPMSPLETAVWWTEYVLRHNDTSSFMKPMSSNQTWFHRRLLDVWAFIFVILLSGAIICFKILYVSAQLISRISKKFKKVKTN